MSARRQPSTTSLAKYARTTSPDTSARNLDFCNAFWGVGDGGVDVLFARMRGAARTMEELRSFWKERSSIEEDYAKRLAKLAKMPIGKDEIGELRNSIDTLRLETDKQAGYHSQLAQQIRTDLEGQVGAFVSRQQHHKKVVQAAIEKEYKVKQTREQHASKAREKYESDCLRINSYTAQSTLVQGKDLEKIHLKLERAQQTVQVNENDCAQFTRVLQETMVKWEQDWKTFCDTCQDLEEERMEFMKDNMWAYANAVSTVCVSDDESCEKMRLALEQLEPEKDMENFVRDYGTGNAIPEPPMFVNYANTDAPPVSSARVTTRAAVFVRSTQRTSRGATSLPLDDEPYDDANHAGVGAGSAGSAGGSGPSRNTPTDPTPLSRSATQRSQANGVNGHVSPAPAARDPQRRHSTISALNKPVADPIDPTVSNTQLVIGDRAWDVDPSKDPQVAKSVPTPRTSPPVGEQDPLVKQMAELTAASGTGRRNTIRKGTTESLSTPSPSNAAASRDFRNSAEVVVGSYPLASPAQPQSQSQVQTPTQAQPQTQGPSRAASPNPPKAVLVAPPAPSIPPSNTVPIEQVVSGYQRVFPGEARSRANSYVGPPPVVSPVQAQGQQGPQGQALEGRPTSRAGYPGVGTQMVVRPTSPAKIQQGPIQGSSPVSAVQTYNPNVNANRGPAPSVGVLPGNGSVGSLHRGLSVSHSQSHSLSHSHSNALVHAQRPVTPNNSVGITLGPDGRVVHDMMVQQGVRQQGGHYPGAPPPAQVQTQVQVAQPAYGYQHQPQHQHQQQQAVQAPPPPRNDYTYGGQTYSHAHGHSVGHQHPHQHTGHGHVPQHAPSAYDVQAVQPYHGQTQGYPQVPPPPPSAPPSVPPPPPSTAPGPAPQNAYGYDYGTVARSGTYHHHPQQSRGGYSNNVNVNMGGAVYRPTSPGVGVMGGGMGGGMRRSPSPAARQAPPPTGTYTDNGRPILFYVKALYDYAATIDEEFDFQAGDIIAVTDTPEDGWWSGELLDDTRRQTGRHVFPSNFVCLF